MGQAGKDHMVTLSFPVIDEPAWGLNTQLSTYCWGLMGWTVTKCLFFFFLKQSRKIVGRNSLGCWPSSLCLLLSSCIQAIHSPGLGRQCTPTVPPAGYQDGTANLNVTGLISCCGAPGSEATGAGYTGEGSAPGKMHIGSLEGLRIFLRPVCLRKAEKVIANRLSTVL